MAVLGIRPNLVNISRSEVLKTRPGTNYLDALGSILKALDSEFAELDVDDPKRDNCLLKLVTVIRANSEVIDTVFFGSLRRATKKECFDAGVDYQFFSEKDDLLCFYFFETFGLRLTILLNATSKEGQILNVRRLFNDPLSSKACLKEAASLVWPEE